ncbi:ArsR family transcriptional regulator [Neobacillus piezotolerans]|uniref:ArsR family transcriptional regulator n=1 Tax=Neobacillus piezotolerans TaxID=2259171 RepID=A0A3D8GL87_9BACI|nr:metalloregulator ArsR/SmtB family transcription factor [Neobacillus piezotolerans]RDU35215.1 ArsR family transcriptional regulator [Neobacillus piezotolerans]
MLNTKIEIEQTSLVLKLLGDKTRLTIMALLNIRDLCVCELLEVFDMSQPSISQHLRKLKDAGLVKEERKGQWIYYSLNKNSNAYPLMESVLEFVPEQTEKMEHIIKSSPTMRCGC